MSIRGKALPTQSLREETIWFTPETHIAQFTSSPKGAELGEGDGPGVLGLQAAFLQDVTALCDTRQIASPSLSHCLSDSKVGNDLCLLSLLAPYSHCHIQEPPRAHWLS